MKKLISAILTVALVLSFMPGMTLTARAETEGDYEYDINRNNGKATIRKKDVICEGLK